MSGTAEIALGLVVVITAAVTIARKVQWPYPIVLVIVGLLLSFVPGLPQVQLEPETVFLIFLPPLLYSAAWQTSWRDFRFNLRPITLLAVGLVFITTLVVGVVAHYIVGLPWAVAFTLGAIVSSTDAVAATAILRRLGAPRRIVTVLEGESLVNDAAALVAYRAAVAAVTTGVFSLWDTAVSFAVGAVAGVAIGLVVGAVFVWVEQHLDDPPVEILTSVVPPYIAYVVAEQLHVSGVLAVVTAGLYAAYRSSSFMGSRVRTQAWGVWEIIEFSLNGLIFVLIGFQLRELRESLTVGDALVLLRDGAIISVAVIVIRILWTYPATYLPRLLSRRLRERDPSPLPQSVAVISWAGMRGVISLATALALPLTVAGGAPFPERERVLVLTFVVIFATLVGQGLTLGPLIKRLDLQDDGGEEREAAEVELRTARAALARLEELEVEEWVMPEKAERIRSEYEFRVERLVARCAGDGAAAEYDQHRDGYHRLLTELLTSERHEAIALRNRRVISDDVLHRVEHQLDLAQLRLEA